MKNGGIASIIIGTDGDSSTNIVASSDQKLTIPDNGPSSRLPRSASLADASKCVIYFLAGAGLIKIGITTNPTSRLRSIRNNSPVPLETLALMPNVTMFNEMRMHGRFSKLRRHGEWFEDEGSIREYVNELLQYGRALHPTEHAS